MHGGNQLTLITLRGNAQAFFTVVRISECHRAFGAGSTTVELLHFPLLDTLNSKLALSTSRILQPVQGQSEGNLPRLRLSQG